MAEHPRVRSREDRDGDGRSIPAREAVRLAPACFTEMTHRQAVQTTAVEPTGDGGWVVEVEVVEDRRVPSSTDMLALYEIELDGDGELLAYQRTRRYMRAKALDAQDTDLDTGIEET